MDNDTTIVDQAHKALTEIREHHYDSGCIICTNGHNLVRQLVDHIRTLENANSTPLSGGQVA